MVCLRPVVWGLCLAACLCMTIATSKEEEARPVGDHSCKQTSVVLVGANGDLAKRYLWPAIFSLFRKVSTAERLVVVAGTRRLLTKENLTDLVNSSLQCGHEDSDCTGRKARFLDQIIPRQLKVSSEYASLAELLQGEASRQSCVEHGRLFYLSIPPFAFASVSGFISGHCRLESAWLRVVFEKPFGHDLQSAQELSNALKVHLREEEILRTDHYLGKTMVASMMDLRHAIEKQNGNLWNRRHVTRVDIVVKETLDVAGRTSYYNQYGVIRDMLQNHLTELLALVTMDVNHTSLSKLDILNHVKSPTGKGIVLGQYDNFNNHLQEEEGQKSNPSHTATFASALLWLTDERWRGVPFLLTSGKVMTERTAYVRVQFNQEAVNCPEEVRFHIQGGLHNGPRLVVSEGLFEQLPALRDDWQWDDSIQHVQNCAIRIAKPQRVVDPYTAIVQAAVEGGKRLFVDTAPLLASWRIWSPVLQAEPYLPLRIYNRQAVEAGYLRTTVVGGHLSFAVSETSLPSVEEFSAKHQSMVQYTSGQFAESYLVQGNLPVIVKKLASDILALALQTVTEHGAFHIALPGGKSPLPLFQALAFDSDFASFPWHYIHIWQTDERCVSDTTDDIKLSNFAQLSLALLQYVPIPARNVHRMPVRLQHGLCRKTDGGDLLYESELNSWNSTDMDLVVLGVGEDGHVASLFPGNSKEMNSLVTVACRPGMKESEPGACRMTLTHKHLSLARNVFLFIHGHAKRSIVEKLRLDATELPVESRFPALQVTSDNPTKATWYIDIDALP